ncbi:MAG: PD-(D/E)XK nuclease family protein [Flavobacteriaceae bacterium]|nr:PD-(D/E)XK nuclease family protein [Flavobacteriaceae bacterium]
MQSFISKCLVKIGADSSAISESVFVLPSKRAGVFLKKELSKYYQTTFFLPKIISIEEFIEDVSGLTTSSNLETLFTFYNVYASIIPDELKESFESFSKWGQILLHDFNEIDRYGIDAKDFFSNLSNIKQIENWSPSEEPTTLIKNYLDFWRNSYQYYDKLQSELLQNGVGYQGLVYREASEHIEHYIQSNQAHHYFLGFNALNASEETIFQELLQQDRATVLFDTDQLFFESKTNSASHFLRKYNKEWNYYDNTNFSIVSNEFSSKKNIDVIALPKNIGQVKKVGELLSKLSALELKETAVVLGDESLLLPLLNSLPKNVTDINITMGMSLKDIPLVSFFDSIFQLYYKQSNDRFYYKKLLTFLNNNYTRLLLNSEDVNTLIYHIQHYNIISITKQEIIELLPDNFFLKQIVSLSKKTTVDCIDVFKAVILELKRQVDDPSTNQLDLEYLYRFNEVFNVLGVLQEKYKSIKSLEEFYQIYKEVLSTDTLDFKGEPVHGLQIMGMLESRVLDFKRVILTSVNEGILPSGKSHNSFIPFDLKIAFKLPTYYEKDAVYAYHFFRLLQRAENISLIYNTESDGLNAGEKSRFLLQLESLVSENHVINYYTSSPKIPSTTQELQVIQKDEKVLERLKEIAAKGFSPSALTQYVRNPIDFYQQKVLRIYEEDAVEETVAANTLGTIVHNTLENFYKPLENQILTKEAIKLMQQNIDTEVSKQFLLEFKKGDITKGKNLIIFNIAKRYVVNFLKQELKLIAESNEVIIRHIESDLRTEINVPGLEFPIFIAGKVDRIDEVDGTIRIIDYKTGKVDQSKVEIVNWEDITTDYTKYSKPFQILMYAYMIQSQKQFTKPLEAGIISFKNLSAGFLKFSKKDKTGRGAKKDTVITQETFDDFLIELHQLIHEICNINIDFTEKEV